MFDVGAEIRKLRNAKDIPMDELAERIGVTKSTISKWEKGDIKNVSRNYIESLAKELGTTPCHLMGWDTKSDEDDSVTYYAARLNDLAPRDRNAVYSLIDYYLRS